MTKSQHETFIEGLLAMGVHMEHPDAKALHEARAAEKAGMTKLPVGPTDPTAPPPPDHDPPSK